MRRIWIDFFIQRMSAQRQATARVSEARIAKRTSQPLVKKKNAYSLKGPRHQRLKGLINQKHRNCPPHPANSSPAQSVSSYGCGRTTVHPRFCSVFQARIRSSATEGRRRWRGRAPPSPHVHADPLRGGHREPGFGFGKHVPNCGARWLLGELPACWKSMTWATGIRAEMASGLRERYNICFVIPIPKIGMTKKMSALPLLIRRVGPVSVSFGPGRMYPDSLTVFSLKWNGIQYVTVTSFQPDNQLKWNSLAFASIDKCQLRTHFPVPQSRLEILWAVRTPGYPSISIKIVSKSMTSEHTTHVYLSDRNDSGPFKVEPPGKYAWASQLHQANSDQVESMHHNFVSNVVGLLQQERCRSVRMLVTGEDVHSLGQRDPLPSSTTTARASSMAGLLLPKTISRSRTWYCSVRFELPKLQAGVYQDSSQWQIACEKM